MSIHISYVYIYYTHYLDISIDPDWKLQAASNLLQLIGVAGREEEDWTI